MQEVEPCSEHKLYALFFGVLNDLICRMLNYARSISLAGVLPQDPEATCTSSTGWRQDHGGSDTNPSWLANAR